MAERQGIIGKLVALAKGEVAADTLEAYRRAGQTVYDLLKQVEDRRLELKIQGSNPWTVDLASQAQFLCAWNAFVLQTLGDRLLEADYQADPSTVGYVPPMTAEQALAYYSQVESWLNRAHQAQYNPAYQVDGYLPADLPPWEESESCPNTHLDGMVEATRLIRTHAEAAIATFEAETIPAEKQSTIHQIRQLLAAANSEADYAEQLWKPNLPQAVHPKVERYAKAALASYYHLGQILAMPQLLEHNPSATTQLISTSNQLQRPLPGEVGFDPWCLTDPAARDEFQRNTEAKAAIATIWKYDPDPERTLEIQAAIDAALAQGAISYAKDRWGTRLGHYYCCPWAPIYEVKRAVTIHHQQLQPGQEFTLDISAMTVAQGGTFKRKLLVGSFQPTDEICISQSTHRDRPSHHRGC
ncbi:hypothetical protein [Pseudanabaena sp. PCC 6802]|uniref:hypothetical protein n=1 Tax=Pseudanabaena sp. PCC 6802 TaxID=118173 RepID=UPI00037E416D|nr:hypothetical protein [Pseudanabaena sp. PCC 6802]